MDKLFNDDWEFSLDDGEYEKVKLPHDWLISDTANLYKSGIGRYRRSFDASFLKDGQRLLLNFDGVYMDCVLIVNGQTTGEWKYGYTAFEIDITPYILRTAENIILVEVNHQSPNSRWYSGAGIYRDVTLKIRNEYYFISDGIYITTQKSPDGRWDYTVTAEVETGGQPYELKHTLLSGQAVVQEPGGTILEWDIESPHTYILRSELFVNNALYDVTDTRFGFREIAFDPIEGFFLNGRHLKLYGVCLHHDLGAFGAAVHKDAIRRQLTLMRGMGVNALRTAHNPPAKVFMELADEMGFLVMSEISDIWERSKTTFDYARFFDEWIDRDVASWIRRDRNCPSLIMWSVGNEIYDTHADAEHGGKILLRLMELVSFNDPGGHARATLCSNYLPWENTQKCADLIKLIGYNYAENLYQSHHETYPDWIIYGGETCSTVQSRGVYHFPLRKSMLSDDDLQCSALGNSTTSWGAESVEKCILDDFNASFSLGQFVWTGQDYIGEPTPYHTKNSYFGHVDTAGFPKDTYYIFKAAWTKEPVIHIFPHWDHSPGQMVDVRVCTNLPSTELFLNGKSFGSIALSGRYLADWCIPFEPGELRAVGYHSDGTEAAYAVKHSFGDAVRLTTHTDSYGTLHFITISALDINGNVVENANNRVNIIVEKGTLVGLDNGDSTDYDQYSASNRRLFNGKLMAIIRTDGDNKHSITASFDKNDVPVRKIELIRDGYTIKAKRFPTDATGEELHWRLTDAAGIDSPLGFFTVNSDGNSAVIEPKGDGEVWVRCAVNNGHDHIALISQLSLTIEGVGKPFLDPYSFVAGGLSNRSNVRLMNGNERGIVSARVGESHIGFADLDFGSYGSDELTLPLFPLSSDDFDFEVWEGMPGESGERLCVVHYDQGSIWNTYQDVSIKLPRRLNGITTLSFVFWCKVHLKGFVFVYQEKAFARLDATESTSVNGDHFIINKGAVEGIGNNVSIVYQDMDFGEAGTAGVTLSTRSLLLKNSVLLLFSSESGGEQREMAEVTGAPQYTVSEHHFTQNICGRQTVTLIFLPGSNLDLEWLCFI